MSSFAIALGSTASLSPFRHAVTSRVDRAANRKISDQIFAAEVESRSWKSDREFFPISVPDFLAGESSSLLGAVSCEIKRSEKIKAS
jgi:hypothetical protein